MQHLIFISDQRQHEMTVFPQENLERLIREEVRELRRQHPYDRWHRVDLMEGSVHPQRIDSYDL